MKMPYIEDTGPGRTRLRIKNKRRFIGFFVIVALIVLALLAPIKGDSKTDYIEYKVSYGETYWEIAKALQKAGYRAKADIRDIVSELVEKSGIQAHELREGDKIYIPDMEGIGCQAQNDIIGLN